MTDESEQTWPFTIDRLLDGALLNGWYGAFTANMHGDNAIQDTKAVTAKIVASAQERGVPVVSAGQMLDWLDGRNASSFENLGWTGTQLSFTVSRHAKARGLQAMVPFVGRGGALTGITFAGAPVSFTIETIKGVLYAIFPAVPGDYVATYPLDITPPAISGVGHQVLSGTSAVVKWTTSEDALSRVDYGTSPDALTSGATGNIFRQSHSVTLNGLAPDTIYYYRVISNDLVGNPATSPTANHQPRVFRTYPPLTAFSDATAADFTASTHDAGSAIVERDDGEVILAPVASADFSGTAMPAGWIAVPRGPGGSTTVSNGQLHVDHAAARTQAAFGPGHTVEFVATFGTEQLQHAGLADTFTTGEPWAIFSTWLSKDTLYARSTNGVQFFDTPIRLKDDVPTLGIPHKFRIVWTASTVRFYVDGALVATHQINVTGALRLSAGDYELGGVSPKALDVNWMRLAPYAPVGTLLSRVFDGGGTVSWFNLVWNAVVPINTGLAMSVRTGHTPTPDASWTAFGPVGQSGALIRVSARYAQYRAELSTTDFNETPELQDVTLNSSQTTYVEPDDPEANEGPNTPPISADDTLNGFEDKALTIDAPGLLANDSDADGDILQVSAVSTPPTGTLVVNPNGSLTFTPSANVFGPVMFTYRASDGRAGGDGNLATVTLNIVEVNDAPSFIKGVDQEVASGTGAQTVAGWATNIAAGPADEGAQTLTFVIEGNDNPGLFLTQPAVSATGTLSYAPAPDAKGVANITLRLVDNGGTANSGSNSSMAVTFAIRVVANEPPVTADDSYTTLEDTQLVVAAPGLLVNDSDADGDALQVALVSPPASGSLGLNTNGSFTYTPADNVIGPVTFTYRAKDPKAGGDGNLAIVTINVGSVNDAPRFIAGADHEVPSTGSAAQVVPFWASGIAAGPPDEAAQTLAFVIDSIDNPGLFLTPPAVTPNGTLTYTPTPLLPGVAHITLRLIDDGGTANDGVNSSPAVTFAIRVVKNELPASADDSYSGVEDTPFVLAAPGVLGNDGDADGDSLRAVLVSPPASGMLALNPDGSLSFTPADDVAGPVTFTYRANDTKAGGDGNVATVTLDIAGVNDAPHFVKGADQAAPSVGGAQTVGAWATGIAAGPASEAAQSLTFVIDGNDNPGLFLAAPAVSPNGTLTYTPRPAARGVATITLRLVDSGGTANGGVDSSPAETFTIGVTNAPPVSGDNVYSSLEELPFFLAAPGVLANDSDGDGDPIQAVVVSPPATGTLVLGADGSVTYTPAPNVSGPVAFTYRASDGKAGGDGNIAIVTINIANVNDAPGFVKGADQSVAIGSGAQTVSGWATGITAGAGDEAGQTLTFVIESNDNPGLFLAPPAVAANGTLTYTPTPYALGMANLTLRLTDNGGTADGGVDRSAVVSFAIKVTGQGAAYGFEELSGGSIVDSTGNNNTGTFDPVTGPQRTESGRFGRGMVFNGLDDMINVADHGTLDLTSAMTLMAWIKVDNRSGWRTVLMKERQPEFSYALYAADADVAGRPTGYVRTGSITRTVAGLEVAPINGWMHVAVTMGTSQLRFYVNGVLHRSVASSGSLTTSNNPLRLGGNQAYPNEFFSGVMDEVRIFGRELTVDDIRKLMQTPVGAAVSAPTPPPPPPSPSSGLVAAYNFDDGTATDKSGLGNNGVLNGPQAVDGALRFDGVNDLVSIAAAASLDLTTGMTVEAWVRPTSVTGWRSIIVKEAPAPLGLSYALYASDTASRAGAYVAITGNTKDLPGSVLPVNVWTHVVMTYDSSTLRIWIDGVPNASLPMTGAIDASASQLSIGGNRLWGEYFAGLIDNVRIYNRALDAGEIQSNRVTPVP
jgi:hypothetical protein